MCLSAGAPGPEVGPSHWVCGPVAVATAAFASSKTSSASAACAARPNANVAVAHTTSRLFLTMLSPNVIVFLPLTRIGGRSHSAQSPDGHEAVNSLRVSHD